MKIEMSDAPHTSSDDDSSSRPLRRHGRILCEGLSCNLGIVTNISASGVHLWRHGRGGMKVNQIVDVQLAFGEMGVCIAARILRIKRIGLVRMSFGIEFITPSQTDQALLAKISHAARLDEGRIAI